MQHIAPAGDVYQAGTLSGNPLAVAAGLSTLRVLQHADTYATLNARAEQFASGLRDAATSAGVSLVVNQVGPMCGFFFADRPPRNFADVQQSDTQLYARFFHGMLDRGYALAPSAYEACFISLAHSEQDIDSTVSAARDTFAAL